MSVELADFDPSQKINFLTTSGVTFSGYDCDTPGQVREVWARDRLQNKGKLRFVIDWALRGAFCSACLGGTLTTSGGAMYTVPTAYPDNKTWIPQTIEVRGARPLGIGPNGVLAYKYADMLLNFGVPDFSPGSQNGTGELELDWVSNSIALDQNQPCFQFTSGAKVIPPSAFPALRYTTILFSLARYDQPSLPVNLVTGLVDKTNSGTFYGAPPETVLFRGAHSDWKTTASGGVNWNVKWAMEVKNSTPNSDGTGGWNTLFNPASQLWDPFTTIAGTKMFPTADFSPLIT